MVWYLTIFSNIRKCQNIQNFVAALQNIKNNLIGLPFSPMITKQADQYNYVIFWMLLGLYMALTLQTFTVDIKHIYSWIIILFWKCHKNIQQQKKPTLCATHVSLVSSSTVFHPLWYFGTIMTVQIKIVCTTISPVHNFRQITQEILSLAFITINDDITNIQREQNTKIVICLSYKFHICL